MASVWQKGTYTRLHSMPEPSLYPIWTSHLISVSSLGLFCSSFCFHKFSLATPQHHMAFDSSFLKRLRMALWPAGGQGHDGPPIHRPDEPQASQQAWSLWSGETSSRAPRTPRQHWRPCKGKAVLESEGMAGH